MKRKLFLFTLTLLSCVILNAQKKATKLVLQLDKPLVTVSPTLYGLMTEEINYSYEGGLYAQLIRNPSFKDEKRKNGEHQEWPFPGPPEPAYWTLSDTLASDMAIDKNEGINSANEASLCLNVKESGKQTGLLNDGFWGFPIRAQTMYKGSLYIKTTASGSPALTISLESLDGKIIYASTQISGISGQWEKYQYSFSTPTGIVPTKDARFRISTDTEGKYWFTRVTLFPPTFNNRPNGLRPDLMTMMRNMKPKFLRFPGGNYLEGNTFSDRFDWKTTIGDPDLRPGHKSPWGYRSTDGLGFLEFLEWTEDIGAEPMLAVFAGYVLNRDYLTGDYLKPFVQDALDEIEYVIGGPDTKWGAQRVKDGHPEPFKLQYVEIGNEDWFDNTGSYTQRYKQFYDAIKTKYPQLGLISTIGGRTNMGNKMNVPGVKLDIIDEHYYRNAADMYRNAFQYDSYDRKGPKIFCGEWATREGEPTTNMNAALGDAAWMTCMERNSDMVIMSCYAPLFVNVSPGGMQWKSDLIGYDALKSYGSPSYYAQAMFGNYLGDKIVPINGENIPKFDLPLSKMDLQMGASPSTVPEIYSVATKDSKTGIVYLKVVNVVGTSQKVSIVFDGKVKVYSKALKVELKAAHPEDTNTIDNPKNIVPVKSGIAVSKKFNYTFAPYSITVLQINTK
jgi:alpha-L-arabinofuranosidase